MYGSPSMRKENSPPGCQHGERSAASHARAANRSRSAAETNCSTCSRAWITNRGCSIAYHPPPPNVPAQQLGLLAEHSLIEKLNDIKIPFRLRDLGGREARFVPFRSIGPGIQQ